MNPGGGVASNPRPDQSTLGSKKIKCENPFAVRSAARIDVIAYHDDAIGDMPQGDRPVRITRITLRPRITVRGDVADARVLHLVEVGHRECYIANSVTTDISIDAEIVREPMPRAAD